ncbi:MAG: type II secretion system protein, partial [Kiritimatiellae bacterium]|nr:type II secretion system protein [Kiritimatiellia bacterium]
MRQACRCAGCATPLSCAALKAVPQPALSAPFVTALQNVEKSQPNPVLQQNTICFLAPNFQFEVKAQLRCSDAALWHDFCDNYGNDFKLRNTGSPKSMIRALISTLSSQASCQMPARGKSGVRGFTLLELLVVIVIIGILGSALVVSVQSGYKQARQANCKSNLRQFGVALTIYRGEHDNRTPDWLSNLYPDYVDDRSLYVCRADYYGGRAEPRPNALTGQPGIGKNDIDTKKSFWDNKNNSDSKRNPAIECCSYLYEFSAATTSWRVPPAARGGTPNPSSYYCMRDYKMDQMNYGDKASLDKNDNYIPHSASRIPIIRCYHHWKDQRILGYANETASRPSKQFITINVAYAGN